MVITTMLYIFAILSAFLGGVCIWKVYCTWQMITKKQSTTQPEDLRFGRFQYRLRLIVGFCLVLLGYSLAKLGFLFMETQASPAEMAQGLVLVVLLLFLLILVSIIDGISSYIYLSKKNAREIIEEEKAILKNARSNRKKQG